MSFLKNLFRLGSSASEASLKNEYTVLAVNEKISGVFQGRRVDLLGISHSQLDAAVKSSAMVRGCSPDIVAVEMEPDDPVFVRAPGGDILKSWESLSPADFAQDDSGVMAGSQASSSSAGNNRKFLLPRNPRRVEDLILQGDTLRELVEVNLKDQNLFKVDEMGVVYKLGVPDEALTAVLAAHQTGAAVVVADMPHSIWRDNVVTRTNFNKLKEILMEFQGMQDPLRAQLFLFHTHSSLFNFNRDKFMATVIRDAINSLDSRQGLVMGLFGSGHIQKVALHLFKTDPSRFRDLYDLMLSAPLPSRLTTPASELPVPNETLADLIKKDALLAGWNVSHRLEFVKRGCYIPPGKRFPGSARDKQLFLHHFSQMWTEE